MAKFSAQDYDVTVGGTNLSDHLDNVELSQEADELETTNFDSNGWRERIGGLKSASVTLNFHQDFAASEVDATIQGVGVGSTTTIVIKPTSSSVSSTNPSYTMTAFVSSYNPIGASVGDLAAVSVTWPVSGEVTRATS